jgi:hypothetical protein
MNTTKITSGRIKKKARKMVYNPADLQVSLPEIQESIPKKKAAASKSYIRRSSL